MQNISTHTKSTLYESVPSIKLLLQDGGAAIISKLGYVNVMMLYMVVVVSECCNLTEQLFKAKVVFSSESDVQWQLAITTLS